MAQTAHADIITETEPNDTQATANQTVGFNNLGFQGALTLGDIDTYSILAIPESDGRVDVSFDISWSAGTTSHNPPFSNWLNVRLEFDPPGGFTQLGAAMTTDSTSNIFSIAGPKVLYFQVFSTSPNPNTGGNVTGSTVVGDYSVTNIRGTNGTIVVGTATPEPGVFAVVACAGITGGVYFRRRKRNGQ